MTHWTPEQLHALMLSLPGDAPQVKSLSQIEDTSITCATSLNATEVNRWERLNSALLVHQMLPDLGQAHIDPLLNWSRARALLEPVRTALGKAYRLAVALYAVAMARRQEGQSTSTFVLTRWELGGIIGVSDDYVGQLLREYRVLRGLMYWGTSYEPAAFQKWARKRAAIDDESRTIHHRSGILFHVRLLDDITTNDLAGRVKGNESIYRRYKRGLAADVYRGHTKRQLQEEGRLPRNARGTVRDVMLSDAAPQRDSLELLRYVTLRTLGLLPADVVEDPEHHIRDVNDLLSALREPVTRSKERRTHWVQRCALGFVRVLGTPRDTAHWLKICWSAICVTGAGITNAEGKSGVELLYEAAFEVLVRSSDNQSLTSGPSRARLIRWLLRGAGYFEMRAEYDARRVAIAT